MVKFLILLVLFIVPTLSWAEIAVAPHQNQGFETYSESSVWTRFNCKKQCFIILWGMGQSEYIKLRGQISGSGSIGYGFLNGQQIIPGEFRSVTSRMTMNDKILFSNNQYFSQIPKELPIVIVISGEVASDNIAMNLWNLTFGETIVRSWNQFFKTENLAQYSINLLYGYSVWETSLTWILSLLFFIVVLGIIFVYSFDRRRFFLPIFIAGIIFVVFYDLREQINLSMVRKGYYDTYDNKPTLEQKNWFGIGYYPDILEKASQYVVQNPVWQKIYLAAMQNFPLFGYSQYHLHPAETLFVDDMKNITWAKKWDVFIRYFSALTPVDGWKIVYASQDGGSALYIKQ